MFPTPRAEPQMKTNGPLRGRGHTCIQPRWVSFPESPSNIEQGARLQIQLTDVRSQAPPTIPWNGSATKTPRTTIHVFIRLDSSVYLYIASHG